MSFMTVEDVNSILLNYDYVNDYYIVDTSLITNITEGSYDFVRFRKIENGFKFKIDNSLWTGGVYVLNAHNEYIPLREMSLTGDDYYRYANGTLTIYSTNYDLNNCKIVLYLSSFFNGFHFQYLNYAITNLKPIIDYNEPNFEIQSFRYDSSDIDYSISFDEENGTYTVIVDGDYFYGYLVQSMKIADVYLVGDLIVGIDNTLTVVKDESSSDLRNCIVVCNGKEHFIDFTIPNGDKFNIDLTDETSLNPISFQIIIKDNDEFVDFTCDYSLTPKYYEVSNFNELKTALTNKVKNINITKNITFTENIVISNDTVLNFNFNRSMFNHVSFIISENTNFILKKAEIIYSNTLINQKKGSAVTIDNCKIYNSSNANNKSSVVYCDEDINDIYEENTNFTTNILNSEIRTCALPTIIHFGTLNIDNSIFYNTNNNSSSKNVPCFIYQVNGDAIIKNSIFKIKYAPKTLKLCEKHKDIGINHCNILIGENATINNASFNDLKRNNSLPFFDKEFNNKSYVYCEYYYPSIESCVIASPLPNFEDKCCCHALSGVDWVFKNNVQITRKEWGSENTLDILEI